MTGPGIFSYSTTPANNVTANTGINWDEGMSPAAVNNSARQNMTDMRNAFNDLIWFRYGKGDLDYSPVYVSGTSIKITGIDVTAVYHVGRRLKIVGSGTGTVYGYISASSFSTDTTVTIVFDSGSLTNETLVTYISQIPVTGSPVPQLTITEGTGSSVSISGSFTNVTSVALTPGKWRLSATYTENANAGPGSDTIAISTTTASNAGATTGKSQTFCAVALDGHGGAALAPFDVTITSNTTYYLNALSTATTPVVSGYLRAEKIYGN